MNLKAIKHGLAGLLLLGAISLVGNHSAAHAHSLHYGCTVTLASVGMYDHATYVGSTNLQENTCNGHVWALTTDVWSFSNETARVDHWGYASYQGGNWCAIAVCFTVSPEADHVPGSWYRACGTQNDWSACTDWVYVNE